MTFRSDIVLSFDYEVVTHQTALAMNNHKDAMVRVKVAFDLFDAGEKYYEKQQFTDAVKQYQNAAKEIDGLGIFELESLVWGRVSTVAYSILFDVKLALEAFQKLAQASLEPAGRASAYNSIATIYLTADDIQASHQYADLATEDAQKIKDKNVRMELHGAAVFNKGEAFFRQQDYSNAVKHINQAEKMFKKIHHKGGQGKCIAQLGMIASCQQQIPQALELLKKALVIFQELGDQEEIAETKKALSVTLAKTSDFDGAIRELKEAAAIHRKLGQLQFATTALQFAAKIEQIYKKGTPPA